MQRTQFGEMACSIARTADVIGEPWSPLIVRNIYMGMTRFDQLQQSLGISRKVLAERLRWLTGTGVLERREYSGKPPRYEYVLTVKGLELFEVLMVMVRWGDKWLAGEAARRCSTGTARAVRSATSSCTAPNAARRCLPPTSTCSLAPAQPRPAGAPHPPPARPFRTRLGSSCLPLAPGWVVAEDLLDCARPEVPVEYLDAVSTDQRGMGDSAGVAELEQLVAERREVVG